MTDIDEAMLIAWVDGELDEVTRRRVDRAVAEDPALAARLEQHRRLRARLAGHFAPIAQEDVPASMQAMLVPPTVVPIARASRRWSWVTGGAIAASLLLGLGIGHMSGGPDGPIAIRDGAMLAQGPLATALDSQLASAGEDGPVRIGLSFRRKGGGWCRSFDGAAMAGVACRTDAGWQLLQAVPGKGQTSEYRQAASADPRLLTTIDGLIDGAPADAQGERAAQAAGWR
ncbi:anti-sigma factor [Sphingomonas sp. S-NIH.Pt3_0716]|nr:anti-sigma factor [Sphingomonas sp. S-NIH.Pt3_0716]